MREAFIDKKFSAGHRRLIGQMEVVIAEYLVQGYRLTLRQLYYQLVARAMVPNNPLSYKRVGYVLSDARLAGLVDWDSIVDNGRSTAQNAHWERPGDIVIDAAGWYRRDLWADQEFYLEVFAEKDALSEILGPACARWDVPYSANKGYSSSSALRAAGRRLEAALDEGRRVRIIYLGDHDPSGLDMTRDVRERLGLFARYYRWDPALDEGRGGVDLNEDWWDRAAEAASPSFEVHRIALNHAQVIEFGLPPNPAKVQDSRFRAYEAQFGGESWELDALSPGTLVGLVDEAVRAVLDPAKYDARLELQQEEKAFLRVMAGRTQRGWDARAAAAARGTIGR